MIGDLNSFIQYLAALYFTICIDGAFFRRFWSPDYYNLVKDIIGQYKFQQSQTLKDKLNDAIKKHANKIEDRSVKRGVFMLLFCLFFLVYNVFELDYNSTVDKTNEWLSLYASTAYVITIMLMSGFSMKKWRWLVIHSVIFVTIYVIIRHFNIVGEYNIHHFGWVAWFKIFLVIIFLLPIIYQLYINWLYSQAYVQHLISTLNEEYEKYLMTSKAINDRDKELVDVCYTKVFSDSYFDNTGQDVVITNFNQAVLERLIAACRPPEPLVLIKKWISIKYDKNNVEVIRKMESQFQFSNEEVIPPKNQEKQVEVNSQFDQLISEYGKLSGVPLARFCKGKGVDLDSFKKYRKEKLKKGI